MAKPNSERPTAENPDTTLYLLDVSSFIFRAFFAIRALSTPKGEPVNAVYGVASMLKRLIDEGQPKHLVVCYDSKEPSFREEIYADYKANRSAPPDDLIPQFARIDQLVQLLGIHSYRIPGVEADDIIATLTRRWQELSKKNHVVIVTGDKDLMQLVNDRVVVWDTMKEKFYREPDVLEKFGVKASQVRDYLGLVGDSSDNIPGVPGIGAKTAAQLLNEYGDLDGVVLAAKSGKMTGKKAETFKTHEADARLSAQLASLKDDVDMVLDPAFLRYDFHMTPECEAFLQEMNFKSLVEKWRASSSGGPSSAPSPSSAQAGETAAVTAGKWIGAADESQAFRTVNDEKTFQAMLEGIERAKHFGLDLETTSLNPREAEVVGVAICHDLTYGCYIPLAHRGTTTAQLPRELVLEKLRPFIESPRYKKIGQNLKYDMGVLAEQGIALDGIGADTMIAAYVLDPNGRHNLDVLSQKYLDYKPMTYEEVCGKGKTQIGFDQVDIALATRYSAEDALVAMRLWDRLKPQLDGAKLMEVFARVELPLVGVLSRMERAGISVDEGWFKKLGTEFERELLVIEEKVRTFTPGPINLNSPKQLAQLLFEHLKLPTQGKTKTGFSTDADVLEKLAPLHEVPRLLLEYREIAKLKGTYVDPLPKLVDAKTHKIHASFHQTVAATGRLSGSDPNLQNIPIRTERGRRIRRGFVPTEGNQFVSADYSQVELRILAHMSGDQELIHAFQKDEDVHRRTAGEIFGVKPADVDERQRGIAKAINFGLMYGKTAFGLAQELKISRTEAKEMIDRYFDRYRAVKDFLDGQIEQAREKGFTTTLLGRRRPLPDIHAKNPAIRANAERMAMNTPVQGTAADLMKLAMIQLDDSLRDGKYRSRIVVQVHDELLLDCPPAEVEPVRKLLVETMESAMSLAVPLRVNASVGKNWMEL
ncbi:MAG: DNA polymerase I [Bacteriovoracia bacterium]